MRTLRQWLVLALAISSLVLATGCAEDSSSTTDADGGSGVECWAHQLPKFASTSSFASAEGCQYDVVFSNKTANDDLALHIRSSLMARGLNVWQQQSSMPYANAHTSCHCNGHAMAMAWSWPGLAMAGTWPGHGRAMARPWTCAPCRGKQPKHTPRKNRL